MSDILEITLQINEGNAEVVVGKGKRLLQDFVREAEKAQPQIKFTIPNENFINLDKLEKRAESTRKAFQDVAKVRLDSGNINHLTKEIVVAHERATQLFRDITGLKRELANPNRKTSVSFLIDEIRAAEKELDGLNRKLQTVRSANTNPNKNGFQSAGFGDSFESRVFGSYSNATAAGFAGGVAGAATIALIGGATSAVSTLLGTAQDLSLEAVRLGANFEVTQNSINVFAGSASLANQELAAIDKTARDTAGLRLETAERGYQRLRGLGFESKRARNLIKELSEEKILSGAGDDAMQRVIFNFTQIASGGQKISQEIRELLTAMPSLRKVFLDAFGSLDPKKIQSLLDSDPNIFFDKLIASMEKTKGVQGGLNDAFGKFQDSLIVSGREFSKPLLEPLTRDVKGLTEFVYENQTTFARWGNVAANSINFVSEGIKRLKQQRDDYNNFAKNTGNPYFSDIDGASLDFAVPLMSDGLRKKLKEAREAQKFQAYGAAELNGQLAADVEFEKLQEDERKRAKQLEALKTAEKINKFKISEVDDYLQVGKAQINSGSGNNISKISETAELEQLAIKEKIRLQKQFYSEQARSLTPEERSGNKGAELALQGVEAVNRLERQGAVARFEAQKQINEEIKKLKDEFKNDLFAAASVENPLVKQMSELETATERAQKKFGAFGDSVVRQIADIEKANLTKAINLRVFENDLQALKFNQEARRLEAMPERLFADFQRKIELVERTANFTSSQADLERQTKYADYYARKYNPNNPIDADEYMRGKVFNGNAEFVYQTTNALEDIRKLKDVSLLNTGIYGQAAVAKKILDEIPENTLNALVDRIGSNGQEGFNARQLLNERAGAMALLRDAEQQKFNDYLEDQKTSAFGKNFAYEQIGLINKSGLSDADKARQRLSVTEALGNDLDATLRRGRIQDYFTAENQKRDEQKEAARISKEIGQSVKNLENLIKNVITANGLKIDETQGGKNLIEIVDKTNGKVSVTGASATNSDTSSYYQQYENQ